MTSATLDQSPPAPTPPATRQRHRRVLTAAFVGTTVEYYDFYLYATAAALVFGPTFFPNVSPVVGLIASFATYGVGFVARPVGGLVAGHLGDRIGRKKLLVASLLLMGVASTAIGLLPSYDSIGITAVVGLATLRMLQGIAAGAEWGGSALLSVEHAPAHRRGLYGSFTQMGSAGGLLLATGVFYSVRTIMGEEAFLAGGWRIPFLLSAILVVVGLVIRLRLEDAPEFVAVAEEGRIEKLPVMTVLRHHRRAVATTAGLRLVQPALFSILTTYILSYLADQRGDSGPALKSVLIVSALSLASTPLWGMVSDRVGRRPLAIASSVGIAVFIWPFFAFLDHGPLLLLPVVVFLGMNILHDSIYGPQAAWFAEQFPTEIRYTGVSLGYQLGSIVSVGLTPLLAVWLVSVGDGSPWLLCLYVNLLAVLSVAAALVARDGSRSAAAAHRAGVPDRKLTVEAT
ncbi:MHS family MFS transporter [Nocardioides sp. HDW12B]|uniref:MFS transporter n=1 Tax=Nocardioides sp. HDW12B TaxID=2714939 RepID=UPI00140A4776|nr:MFS transporter [Nocardioides sp. HDW12B]QIK67369.1 MHS family MFS transporter [Nocardioides sp. HDW12B]